MASAKADVKLVAGTTHLPECPVCMEIMTTPIYLCQSGHSLCNSCTKNLFPPNCPICRQAMTQMRCWKLEELVEKAKVGCPNKAKGCVYTMSTGEVEDHLKECIFREMECPLGAVFGKCSWKGNLKEMMDHFKERHQSQCNVSSDTDVVVKATVLEDERYFFLTAQGKLLFIITMKIDIMQKMCYWSIQLIGSKKVAQQHVYEIHVTSQQDSRRKIIFSEYCYNDAIKADEIFREGKCGVLPLEAAVHFIKDKKLSFRFFIKRIPPAGPAGKNKNGSDGNNGKPNNNYKGPGGPKGGPKGPGPKGPNQTGPNKPAPKKNNKAQN